MTTETARRVVVADDDADIRALVAISAARAGYDVVASVEDGDRAWGAIQEFHPDLAILDVAMPGLTGLDVCRLARADATLVSLRILLLSAAVDEAARAAGREAGASDYLPKPFSPRALVAWLKQESGVDA
ncbi:response regulator receiver domain-containing protein [Glaciihabitans tibetensis]|uniref:Response regulator receiver domain-containing protein n=1 Tax=Glaciihabitans tibetensis TaxID=1266600 RepID=A0A2T0VGY1_9MICO|nr:response regulator [Glaciihabitans tibetensis]PRY69460.1 response regulator receiver domain-containing protein [Glaciihabitans tibetensis]